MPRARKVCASAGCAVLVPAGQSRCDDCTTEADNRRGTATERGYTSAGHKRFRRQVLRKNPICVVCKAAPSTVADHYPISRRDLLATGLDANDPDRGRGVCKPCHDSETAVHQPGGWNARATSHTQ